MVANHTVRAQSHVETSVVILGVTIPAVFCCSSSGGHRHQQGASVMCCLAQAASASTKPCFGQEPSQGHCGVSSWACSSQQVTVRSQGWSHPMLLPLCLPWGFPCEHGVCSHGEVLLNPFRMIH